MSNEENDKEHVWYSAALRWNHGFILRLSKALFRSVCLLEQITDRRAKALHGPVPTQICFSIYSKTIICSLKIMRLCLIISLQGTQFYASHEKQVPSVSSSVHQLLRNVKESTSTMHQRYVLPRGTSERINMSKHLIHSYDLESAMSRMLLG